jgi:pilus assembly protein CpaB
MKSKNMTLMAIAIGCGLVAAILTAKLSGNNGPELADVIVAKKELPVGTLLEEKELENMVGLAKFPKSSLPPDVILNVEELKGKKLNRTLKANNFFSQGDVANDAGIRIPEGMFKYAIKTNLVMSGAGFTQAGDHVDVVLTETMPNGKTKSSMFLRDMLVLAIDNMSSRPEGGRAVNQVNSVSLAVTSEQSLWLSSAERRGEVKLVLRDSKNMDKKMISATTTIPIADDSDTNKAVVVQPKTVGVIVAKGDVPLNTFITLDNFDHYFLVKDMLEDFVPAKAVKDKESLRGKYIVKALEADMWVNGNWLSDSRTDGVVAKAPEGGPEHLDVVPRELIPEKPLYPRRFEQVINSQHYWFIEIAPGEFRRAEGGDVKDLPTTGAPDKKDEPMKDGKPENGGDRAA